MIREIDHGEAVARIAQLIVQLAQQVVGLRHGVEIAGGLFGLHKLRVLSACPIAGLWVRPHEVQDDQLRLGARGGEDLRRHFQQRFVFSVFVSFKVAIFQELHFVSPFGDAGNRRIVFANLPLIREPPRLKTRAVCQVTKLS